MESELSRLLRDVARLDSEASPRLAGLALGSGRYILVERLGRGGMGDVWRARDHKLHRDVAVKMLSPEIADDAGARARFVREARAAAALTHANVCAIYDVDEADGVPFIAMELLGGSTLRALLSGGALDPRRAAAVALDVARALAAAHDAGIVHRDVKPENIHVLPDGQAKLLDFGLARTPALPEARGPAVTSTGVVLGTARYMSPEQAEGREVDVRSDVFSLGIVLYEMLDGAWPWSSSSSSSNAGIAAAILRDGPRALSLHGDLATQLADIALRCLEKEPDKRFSRGHDVVAALTRALAHAAPTAPAPTSAAISGAAVIPAPAAAPISAPRTGSSRRKVIVAAALALAGAALVGVGGLALAGGGRVAAMISSPKVIERERDRERTGDGASAPPPRTSSAGAVRERITDEPGLEDHPVLSRDGTMLAYVVVDERGAVGEQTARGRSARLVVRRLDGVGAPLEMEIARYENVDEVVGVAPAFSPDGTRIALADAEPPFGLFIMPVPAVSGSEEARRALNAARAHIIDGAASPSWSADGREIVYAAGAVGMRPLSLEAIDVDTGVRRTIFRAHGATDPVVSPRGLCVAFAGHENPRASDVRLLRFARASNSAAAAAPVDVTGDGKSYAPAWSVDGSRLFWLAGRGGPGSAPEVLWAAPVDEQRCIPVGAAEPVFTGAPAISAFAVGQGFVVAATPAGTMAIDRLDGTPAPKPTWGAPVPILELTTDALDLAASPDGARVAYVVTGQEIWVVDRHGRERRRLTHGAWDAVPTFSPTGDRIAFVSQRSGRSEIWLADVDLSASEARLRRLTDSAESLNRAVWSPDGTRLVAGSFDGLWSVQVTDAPVQPKRIPVGEGRRVMVTAWSERALVARVRGGLPYRDELVEIDPAATRAVRSVDGPRDLLGVRGIPGRLLAAFTARGSLVVCATDDPLGLAMDVAASCEPTTHTAPAGWRYTSLDVAADARTVFALRTRPDGDLWRVPLPSELR